MSKKITLVFPGQGSQYVGMGNNLKDSPAYEYFNRADKVLNFSLSELCNAGPAEELKLTKFTQPAIVTHSIALFSNLKKILAEKEITIERVLGHSVGEYSALVAAGSLSFEDAVKAVHLRGQYMQKAVPAGKGSMYAILKCPQEKILEACEQASTEDEKVQPANFNEPNQIVISGHKEACERAVTWLGENITGRLRALELPVSAPFHSTLMLPAEEKMAETLNSLEFKPNGVEYIANIDAQTYAEGTEAQIIKDNLIKQICGSVLWTQSMQSIPEGSIIIEVGPGKVLSGLAKKINRDFKILSLDNDDAWEEVKNL